MKSENWRILKCLKSCFKVGVIISSYPVIGRFFRTLCILRLFSSELVKYLDLEATAWHWALSTHHWVYKICRGRSWISISSLQTSDRVTNANGSQINSRILNPKTCFWKTLFCFVILKTEQNRYFRILSRESWFKVSHFI